jgi:hypothetical protein
MKWFRKEALDDQIKAQIADVVEAYVERSQLSLKILLIDPKLTDMEMAVLWLAGVTVMEELSGQCERRK